VEAIPAHNRQRVVFFIVQHRAGANLRGISASGSFKNARGLRSFSFGCRASSRAPVKSFREVVQRFKFLRGASTKRRLAQRNTERCSLSD